MLSENDKLQQRAHSHRSLLALTSDMRHRRASSVCTYTPPTPDNGHSAQAGYHRFGLIHRQPT